MPTNKRRSHPTIRPPHSPLRSLNDERRTLIMTLLSPWNNIRRLLNCEKIFVISQIRLDSQLLRLETFMSSCRGHVGVPGRMIAILWTITLPVAIPISVRNQPAFPSAPHRAGTINASAHQLKRVRGRAAGREMSTGNTSGEECFSRS